jgi:diaminopimelate decarboxylase
MRHGAGPIHILFPQIIHENIQRLKSVFDQYCFDTLIFGSAKPNSSPVYLKCLFDAGLNIDVSSTNELKQALGVGFTGQDISCTNIKNRAYLKLAINHGALISVDNLNEIEQILQIIPSTRITDNVPILLRLSDPQAMDRNMVQKVSKFGIPSKKIADVIEFILEHQDHLDLRGVHFHLDNPMPDLHAEYIHFCAGLMDEINQHWGLELNLLDIGGGFRDQNIEDLNQWDIFVQNLSRQVKDNQKTDTWNDQAYNLSLDAKGRLKNREKLFNRARTTGHEDFIESMLSKKINDQQDLGQLIGDQLFTLMIEPGKSILSHAGITLFEVIGNKVASNGDNLALINGHHYQIGRKYMPCIADFIHIPSPQNQTTDDPEPWSGYVMDLLCNEEGYLSQKQMMFDQEPMAGDIIAVADTAAYRSDFENATPHQHTDATRLIAISNNGQFQLYDETRYSQIGEFQ